MIAFAAIAFFEWIGRLFFPLARFIFRCIVCGISRILEAENERDAIDRIQKLGWRGSSDPAQKGSWLCPMCAND